jgi:pyruvate/2-oxoglutarate dehydrogenase complex dihydrolipoamide acyltransferase (E2) component
MTQAMTELRSPLQAHIVQLLVQPGEAVQQGQLLLVLEAMKMEHEVCAPSAGTVRELFCAAGDTVQAGEVLALLALEQAQSPAAALRSNKAAPSMPAAMSAASSTPITAKHDKPDEGAPARPDLARVQVRHVFTLDASRPEAMAKRHALGLRSARENIADLIDAGSFS